MKETSEKKKNSKIINPQIRQFAEIIKKQKFI